MLNYPIQQVVCLLQGYSSPVSYLISISPTYCKIRGMSKQHSQADMSLDRSSISSFSENITNSFDYSKYEDHIVLSFGKSYCGMVRNIKNCPKVFLNPSGNCHSCSSCFSLPGMKCICGKEDHIRLRPTQPDANTSYMLFWFNDNL